MYVGFRSEGGRYTGEIPRARVAGDCNTLREHRNPRSVGEEDGEEQACIVIPDFYCAIKGSSCKIPSCGIQESGGDGFGVMGMEVEEVSELC